MGHLYSGQHLEPTILFNPLKVSLTQGFWYISDSVVLHNQAVELFLAVPGNANQKYCEYQSAPAVIVAEKASGVIKYCLHMIGSGKVFIIYGVARFPLFRGRLSVEVNGWESQDF